MTTQIDLLRTIAAIPDDDTPRLVYADWLDENPSPNGSNAARAEFIRLDIQLSREADQLPEEKRDQLTNRKWQLYQDHHNEWEQGIRAALEPDYQGASYDRGFIDSIKVSRPDRLIASQMLFSSTSTLRSLNVQSISDDHMAALATQLDQSRIVSLHVISGLADILDPESRTLTDTGVEPLTRLKNLRTLVIDDARITATGAAMIAERMPGLQELLIDGNPIGDEGAVRIASMGNLRRLGLSGCGITQPGAEAIAQSTTLPLPAKLMGLKSAGFEDMATELERASIAAPAAPPIEWFQTNWKGHPGEILYRTPVEGLSPTQVSELREQVIGTLIRAGSSRESASARVVLRHSAELGQDSLTVVGNGACLSLAAAVGRGQLPGICHTESRWQDSTRQPYPVPGRPNNGRG